MSKINNFGIIGGDKRQASMAESIAADGYNVYVSGIDKISFYNSVVKCNISELLSNSEYIILPLPVTKDNVTINAPYSNEKIYINEQLVKGLKEKTIFCGIKSKLIKTNQHWNEALIYDYFERSEFSIKNAIPTAEGAIEIAMHEYPSTIHGSNCLVAGFGKIGKVLSNMLKGIGANVTVSARKNEDLTWIELAGFQAIKTSEIYKTKNYDIVFNTIPSMIFDADVLASSAENSLVIDLASLPGGVDFEAAKRLGIKSIQALSLPGKVAPKAAGEIIKTTIYNIIKEEFE